MQFVNKLPPIYHKLFPELLKLEYPEEKVATCSNCVLCRSRQSPYIDTKCCAYHPHLANFLIGGLLSDEDDRLVEGKKRILSQINNRLGVTPYGIIPSEGYAKTDLILRGEKFWEKPKELLDEQLCPYYDNGNCSIWKYRENLCVTFFCSSIGGSFGKAFWHQVNKYIKMAETDLAQYSMKQLGWSSSKIKTKEVSTADFNFEDETGKIVEDNYIKLWGDWVGREAEFYKRCYEVVEQLDDISFKKITGIKREILEAAIWETNAELLNNVLPDKLILHPDIITSESSDGHVIVALGTISVKIPMVVFPLFRAFNGNRETSEIFHLGYNVIYSMSDLVDELIEKGLLIKAE